MAIACPRHCWVRPTRGRSLSYSDITIEASWQLGSNPSTVETKTSPYGIPGIVTQLFEPRSWGHFPTSQSTLPGGFISSIMTTTNYAAVGVSGIQLRGNDAAAIAILTGSITNTGNAPLRST